MTHLVKITDQKHPFFGQILPGGLIYHDINHTGDGPDLFRITSNEGSIRLLSTQIDENHYWAQLRAERIVELGADVGDVVMIVKSGSGSYCAKFDIKEPHKITKIGNCGHVEFDGGTKTGASIFRPKVKIIK